MASPARPLSVSSAHLPDDARVAASVRRRLQGRISQHRRLGEGTVASALGPLLLILLSWPFDLKVTNSTSSRLSQPTSATMAPKRSASSNQSIATSFRPTAKKAGSAQQQQQQKQGALNRSSSFQKPAAAPTSRSQSPEKRTGAINDVSTLSKAEVDEAQTLPDLDVDSREWEGIWKTTQREKLGKVGPSECHRYNSQRLDYRRVLSDRSLPISSSPPPLLSVYSSLRGIESSTSHTPLLRLRPSLRPEPWNDSIRTLEQSQEPGRGSAIGSI